MAKLSNLEVSGEKHMKFCRGRLTVLKLGLASVGLRGCLEFFLKAMGS